MEFFMKLSGKIFGGIVLVAMVTVILTTAVVSCLLYGALSNEIKTQIRNEAIYISELKNSSEAELDLSAAGSMGKNRITLIAPDGTVKYDNISDFSDMENHLDRPEIKSALETGTGESARTSNTFGKKTYYYAVRLNDGDVLRIACETSSMFGSIVRAMPGILFSVIFFLALAMAAAGALARSIINPINKIDLDEPLSSDTYDEISPLLVRIDAQNKQSLEQISAIYEAQRENQYIIRHMNDGLIMIGSNGSLITVNNAAEKIFNLTLDTSGGLNSDSDDNLSAGKAVNKYTYLSVCRDKSFKTAAEKALKGISSEITIERGGRTYRIAMSSVARDFSSKSSSGGVNAVFMFIHDITEEETSERIRREFSANVSHELKTPLTSIMGYSEILKSGIAKPEDAPKFLEQINSEAKRLLVLIDDIISLSGLDEDGIRNIEMSDVNICEVAGVVLDELKIKADENKISMELEGADCIIKGSARLLHEMIFNLCDNSIRYNNEGGYVKVRVGTDNNNNPYISVKDNGIGIPADSRERIFERFYRVDKSRSKETGGTGLGLSIVKHAAVIHGGEITVDSEAGRGTEIIITFK